MESIISTSYLLQNEILVECIKQTFEKELKNQLNLHKVNAPLFVSAESGLNDNLNGVERPVTFMLDGKEHHIVHSLAKWKRWYLGELKLDAGNGIVTDMKAIRVDEVKTPIHSHLVDQWDWEKVIFKEQRCIETLVQHGQAVYEALKQTAFKIDGTLLTDKLFVIHTEDLLQLYPTLSAKEREKCIAKEMGAILLIGIGANLSNGKPHDLRAPDYDDWSTIDEQGKSGLNADIIIWDELRQDAMEISSMGIRVDEKALLHQLTICKNLERLELPFHMKLLKKELPYTIGGGIGQSRVAMFLSKKSNITEVQPRH